MDRDIVKIDGGDKLDMPRVEVVGGKLEEVGEECRKIEDNLTTITLIPKIRRTKNVVIPGNGRPKLF